MKGMVNKMKMKRAISAIMLIVMLFSLAAAAVACDGGKEQPQIQKLGDIEDITKGYFAGEENTVSVKLSDYVNGNGKTVYYSSASSDPTVADIILEGDVLKAKLKKGEGTTTVTVTVSDGESEVFALSFDLTAKTYSSIACVGDSLTAGHSWPQEAYPVYLAEKLGEGYTVGQFGMNGASITGTNPNLFLKYTEQEVYTDSISANADVVVIMLGTNDSKDWNAAKPNFKNWYIELIESYQAQNPDVKIILVSAPPTMENNKFGIPNSFIKDFICPIQRQVAEELELPLIDLREIMESREGGYEDLIRGDAAFDGVHFSVEGAKLLADLVIAELKKL